MKLQLEDVRKDGQYDYNRILKYYDRAIVAFARRIDAANYEDYAQEIRLYIYNNLYRYDEKQASLDSYVNILIRTAYRKLIFDKSKQLQFEEAIQSGDIDQTFVPYDDKEYDVLLKDIVTSLKKEHRIKVFYAILYNKGKFKYKDIAKILNMDYRAFFYVLQNIRSIAKKVIEKHK